MLQALESRRLLAAAVAFDMVTGVLSVSGTEKPDRIEVAVGTSPLYTLDAGFGAAAKRTQRGTQAGNYVNVFSEGRLTYQALFMGKALQEINLSGGGGGDELLTCKFDAPVLTLISGGDGDDQIRAASFGAVGDTQLFAGSGNDLVEAGGSSKVGFLVWGEDGDDTIYGSTADDTLFGDVDDRLMAGPRAYVGDDVLYGGAGDDFLCGCDGNDQLYGQSGNDFLDGEGGADMLDGGDGEDTGVFDALDKMIDIEVTTK